VTLWGGWPRAEVRSSGTYRAVHHRAVWKLTGPFRRLSSSTSARPDNATVTHDPDNGESSFMPQSDRHVGVRCNVVIGAIAIDPCGSLTSPMQYLDLPHRKGSNSHTGTIDRALATSSLRLDKWRCCPSCYQSRAAVTPCSGRPARTTKPARVGSKAKSTSATGRFASSEAGVDACSRRTARLRHVEGGSAGPGSTSLPFSLRPPKELRLPYPALPTGRRPVSRQG
jgi:hypothetical protein